jgi:hypothetical protein
MDDMLKYTHALISTQDDCQTTIVGFGKRKDDIDNLYYVLYWADEYNNTMCCELELWNDFHGGIQAGKAYPCVGSWLSSNYDGINDCEDYLSVLQDAGIISDSVWIDSLTDPVEIGRY